MPEEEYGVLDEDEDDDDEENEYESLEGGRAMMAPTPLENISERSEEEEEEEERNVNDQCDAQRIAKTLSGISDDTGCHSAGQLLLPCCYNIPRPIIYLFRFQQRVSLISGHTVWQVDHRCLDYQQGQRRQEEADRDQERRHRHPRGGGGQGREQRQRQGQQRVLLLVRRRRRDGDRQTFVS